MTAFPVAAGVTQVEAIPLSSLIVEQVEAPAHAESVAPLVAVHPTVAPFTGVMPSEATTRDDHGIGGLGSDRRGRIHPPQQDDAVGGSGSESEHIGHDGECAAHRIGDGDGLRPVTLAGNGRQHLAGVGRQQRNARCAHGYGEARAQSRCPAT